MGKILFKYKKNKCYKKINYKWHFNQAYFKNKKNLENKQF